MSKTSDRQGGCQCGAIRYRLLRAPVALYACHCLHCQKQSSSAFGLSMWMERDAVEFTGAEPRIYRTSGGVREEGSTTLSLKAGTLDDTSDIVPTSHLWTKRAQSWLAPVLNGAVCYETEPDSEDALRRRHRAGLGLRQRRRTVRRS